MVTCAWGDWHLGAMLDINIPSLLAPDNMPALLKNHSVKFYITTREADLSRIKSSPSISKLSKLCQIEYSTLRDLELNNPIETHHNVWVEGAKRAKEARDFILFMPPDVVWSNGSFSHISNLLQCGTKIINMNFLRVVYDTARKDLIDLKNADEIISIEPRNLVQLGLDHLHPLMAAYFHDSEYFPEHAEMHFWPVQGEGLLLRNLAREMFLYDPSCVSVNSILLLNEGFDSAEIHFIDDSDDLFALSFAELGKDSTWHNIKKSADFVSIGQWWHSFDSPSNDYVASIPVKWHVNDLGPEWDAVETSSSLFVNKTRTYRESIRLWTFFSANKREGMAQLLSLFILTGLLPRMINRNMRFIISLPNEKEALKFLRILEFQSSAEGRRMLIKFLRNYVFSIENTINPEFFRQLKTDTTIYPSRIISKTCMKKKATAYPVGQHVIVAPKNNFLQYIIQFFKYGKVL